MFKASSEFARASDEAKSALLAALTRRTYANNEVVYLQEDEAQQLYFVVSGHIRLSYVRDDGSAILYAILPPGEQLRRTRHLRRRCPLRHGHGDRECRGRQRLGQEVQRPVRALPKPAKVHRPAGRAALPVVYRIDPHDEHQDTARARGAGTSGARRRARDRGHCGRKVPSVGPVVSQSDLGLMARGARNSVNRILKIWERAGWLAIKDRSILIVNRAAIEASALRSATSQMV